jgi:multidrug efflux pump subunit AcrA (membrane-fusion protein)
VSHPYRTWEAPAGLPILHEVSTPRPLRLLSRLLVGLALVSGAGLAVTPWQQSAAGEGRVVASAPLERQQSIEASIDGKILRWHVREGSKVKAGDPIVDIADNDPDLVGRLRSERDAVLSRIEIARGRVASLEERVEALEATRQSAVTAAAARVRVATQRVRSAEQSVEVARAASATARLNVERQRALGKDGLSSARTVEVAELDYTRMLTDIDRAEAALSGARSEEAAMVADRVRTDAERDAAVEDARSSLASARADIARNNEELLRLDTRMARQSAQSVVAVRDGTILRLHASEGTEMVKTGDRIAVLVPDARDRAVEVWVSGNDAPLVAVGRHVRLQFEGWPALQFSGWPSVAVGSFGGRVSLVDQADDGKGKFRVLITPDGQYNWPDTSYLRQGTRAHAWILLDRVSLGFELWRQFNGFPPSVSQPVEGAKDTK